MNSHQRRVWRRETSTEGGRRRKQNQDRRYAIREDRRLAAKRNPWMSDTLWRRGTGWTLSDSVFISKSHNLVVRTPVSPNFSTRIEDANTGVGYNLGVDPVYGAVPVPDPGYRLRGSFRSDKTDGWQGFVSDADGFRIVDLPPVEPLPDGQILWAGNEAISNLSKEEKESMFGSMFGLKIDVWDSQVRSLSVFPYPPTYFPEELLEIPEIIEQAEADVKAQGGSMNASGWYDGSDALAELIRKHTPT